MCAGSGASHGGKGGAGVAYSSVNSNSCQKNTPLPYYSESGFAKYEGSGGASGLLNKNLGGSGGGIIWISTTNSLILNDTKILAKGANGIEKTGQ